MSKHIMLSYNELTCCYAAVFYNNHRIFDSKNLTHVEMDGLSQIIDFAHLPQTFDAEQLYENMNDVYFDTEQPGQETNFEIMLADLIRQA